MREIKFRAWVNDSYMAIQGTPDLETFQSFMFHYCDQKNLMQFTGLKDKTGKEIYEGDILSTPNKGKGIVQWLECGFILKLQNETVWQNLLWNVIGHYEVVGNIYENSELLTQNS